MKKKRLHMFTATLACLGLLLSGCGGKDVNKTQGDMPDKKEMGRYVEESYEEIPNLGRVAGFERLTDGSLEIYDANLGLFVSNDDGKTWTFKENSVISELLMTAYVPTAAIAKDGGMILPFKKYDEDFYQYRYLSPDGSIKDLAFDNMKGEGEEDFLRDFWFAPDGILYAASWYCTLYEIDIENGTLKEVVQADNSIELVSFTDQYAVLFTRTGVMLYDREKKEIGQEDKTLNEFVASVVGTDFLKWTGGNYSLYAVGGDGGVLYLVSPDGIFRHTLRGGTIEKVMEGSLYAYGDPSIPLWGMLLKGENEFLVFAGSNISRLYYDPDMPSIPEKTLRVYSLEKEDVIQSAVSLFQRKHQDVLVKYETGLTEEDGKTKEDAIKQLNTEIMAGNGPDVLCLKGLPLDSYIEKGMLTDLTDGLNQIKEKEDYFNNLLFAYQESGKTYAVPLQLDITVIQGNKEVINQITDLQSLTDAIKKMREENSQGTLMDSFDAENTLKLLAQSCVPSWQNTDGTLNEEKITEFLTNAREIYNLEKSGLTEVDLDFYKSFSLATSDGGIIDDFMERADFHCGNAITIHRDKPVLAMGKVGAAGIDLDTLYSAEKVNESIGYKIMDGQSQKVGIVNQIAGISSQTKEPELSMEFMQTLLSAENLGKTSNFSVNRTALESVLTVPEENGGMGSKYGSMTMTAVDGSEISFDIYHIENEDKEKILNDIEGLSTFYMQGDMLEQTVLENGQKVLDENLDISQAVTNIKQKVQLYLSE